ncbi:MAG: imidazole glycerol phosphate synthase subunit HisF [Asgard group archaeon]|nr:imidazole glycerol phosphate synthase subunit HisF [Asgard group archaeon]
MYNYSTLAKRIIPCLDVKDGRVVKGVKFKNLKDAGNPVLLGKHYNKEGADELVFLDISATIEGRKSTIEVIKKVAESVLIPFAVGGGIRTIEDMETIINAGAEKVCINTAAVKTPNIITRGAKKFGSQSIIVAIDAKKKENKHWEVITHAGSKPTGMNAIAWARKAEKLGAGELLVTSMDRDGTKKGYDLELLQKICTQVNIPVIASGGAGSYEHFQEAIKIGAEAVLAASLFHYNEITIQNLKEYLKKQNIPVRIQKC